MQIEPVVGRLRIADGKRLADAGPCAEASEPPPRAARGREDEHLFILLNLSESAPPHLCRELRKLVTRTYWSTSGSVTAALRRAANAANRHLFEHNLNVEPSERCYGGLTCAVLKGEDLLTLQAGPGQGCILHAEQLTCFPQAEKLAHIGISPLADVRLHHVFTAPGDTLLLASPVLTRQAGDQDLVDALTRAKVEDVVTDLEQVGGGVDFTALIARWEEAKPASVQVQEAPAVSERPPGRPTAPVEPREAPEPGQEAVRETPRAPERRRPARKSGPGLGERLENGLRRLGRGLGYVWRGITAVGVGLVAFVKWLVGGVSTLFWRTLPGPQETSPRRASRRSPPEENPMVMMAVAVAILLLVIILVVLARTRLAATSRFQGMVNEAEREIALAQAAGYEVEEARVHWEAALELAETAATLQPDAPTAQALQEQARDALDRLDQVERLTATQLIDFGSPNRARRLAIHEQMIFVLDPTDGWVARVTLNQTADGMVEETAPILVRTGQQIGGDTVGQLVDCIWVGQGSRRQASTLLILEANGAVVSYDPDQEREGGVPKLRRFALGTPPPGTPRATGSFEGRFYVLDTTADETGQVWRYIPRDNVYPDLPERYFINPPSKPLANASDMAIDGHIYVLYVDGTVMKLLGGEAQAFEVRGVPGGLGEVAAFAVDPGGDGLVYVADRGGDRVVRLGPEGNFQAQFHAEGAFEALEGLAVDDSERLLYALSGGRLYVAALP